MKKRIFMYLLVSSFFLQSPVGLWEQGNHSLSVLAAETASSGSGISNMFGHTDGEHDNNTWVFVGGKDVAGSFDRIRGARTYIGHFEEYIRGTKYDNNGVDSLNGRQRYTINRGREGMTLDQIVNDYDSLV